MKTNLFIISACILAFFFSVPVCSAKGLYVSGNAGFAMASDSDITDSAVPGITVNTEFDTGLALGAALGYDFYRFRVEGELFYQKNDIKKISAQGVPFDPTGDAVALSFLINGYYDFVNRSAFTPYISAGLGFAQVEFNDLDISRVGFSGSSDTDTVFAYQIGIGVGYALTEKILIDVKYRYFGTEDSEYNTTKAEFVSNNVLLGVRFNF
ncbi:MAG: outer membrane beta-barrel protein [Desulfobacterales bacterium]